MKLQERVVGAERRDRPMTRWKRMIRNHKLCCLSKLEMCEIGVVSR